MDGRLDTEIMVEIYEGCRSRERQYGWVTHSDVDGTFKSGHDEMLVSSCSDNGKGGPKRYPKHKSGPLLR